MLQSQSIASIGGNVAYGGGHLQLVAKLPDCELIKQITIKQRSQLLTVAAALPIFFSNLELDN
jgi:hypothetical protein